MSLDPKLWSRLKTRAKGRCEKCRVRAKLIPHHHTYKRMGRELLTDLWVLCERCHHEEDGVRYVERRLYGFYQSELNWYKKWPRGEKNNTKRKDKAFLTDVLIWVVYALLQSGGNPVEVINSRWRGRRLRAIKPE